MKNDGGKNDGDARAKRPWQEQSISNTKPSPVGPSYKKAKAMKQFTLLSFFSIAGSDAVSSSNKDTAKDGVTGMESKDHTVKDHTANDSITGREAKDSVTGRETKDEGMEAKDDTATAKDDTAKDNKDGSDSLYIDTNYNFSLYIDANFDCSYYNDDNSACSDNDSVLFNNDGNNFCTQFIMDTRGKEKAKMIAKPYCHWAKELTVSHNEFLDPKSDLLSSFKYQSSPYSVCIYSVLDPNTKEVLKIGSSSHYKGRLQRYKEKNEHDGL